MFAGILSNMTMTLVLVALATGAVGGWLYLWHYSPINKLGGTITEQQELINVYELAITNLQIKVENEKVKLEKCKEDAVITAFETEFDIEGNNLDSLYQDYLNYKEDLNETNIIETNLTKPSIRFIF